MEVNSLSFEKQAARALDNETLQGSLRLLEQGWQAGRRRAAAALPEFEELRDLGREIKNHTLAHLDLYLEAFEARVTEAGGRVHWATDAAEANRIVLDICREAGARSVTKSKSMVAEETGLADALESEGIERIETDLGEYIIQLAEEPPSHLVGPAIHKSMDEVRDLFQHHHGGARIEEPAALVGEARRVLRSKYGEADIGITGANFLIAETGSVVTVTNEGNAELTHGLPDTHVVITSIEKMVPRLVDAMTCLRLLARSATGQDFAGYTTFMTGPRREGDLDGPSNFHVVLLDNGRSGMLGTPFQEMLRCIRCGACMNHCPIYLSTGGHAYGWVYVGPMGSVLTPQFIGIEKGYKLPNASTFCGRCEEVCPMRIPLPRLMRGWREKQHEQRVGPGKARLALAMWAFVATRPRLYRLMVGLPMRVMGWLGRRDGGFEKLPLAGGWTNSRNFPTPQGPTFMSQWKKRRAG